MTSAQITPTHDDDDVRWCWLVSAHTAIFTFNCLSLWWSQVDGKIALALLEYNGLETTKSTDLFGTSVVRTVWHVCRPTYLERLSSDLFGTSVVDDEDQTTSIMYVGRIVIWRDDYQLGTSSSSMTTSNYVRHPAL